MHPRALCVPLCLLHRFLWELEPEVLVLRASRGALSGYRASLRICQPNEAEISISKALLGMIAKIREFAGVGFPACLHASSEGKQIPL